MQADKEREGRCSGDYVFFTVCEIHFSGFIEALDAKGIVRMLTSETISDSAEVMQDCHYFSSHLLPVCNLLVQGPKITYNFCLPRRS